jgi:hypothetical protein
MSNLELARQWENEARRLEERLDDPKIFGVKCWYSDAALISNDAERAFIGINPGGGPESEKEDSIGDRLERPYTRKGYNSWLDDDWWEGGEKRQRNVRRSFEAMYGASAESKLRLTASFNVVPFRTRNAADLSDRAWREGTAWFMNVLTHIDPKLIICNGNGENGSPWSVIDTKFSISRRHQIEIGAKGSVKEGVVNSGQLKGCRIIGLPNLSRFGRESLYSALGSLKPFT